MLMSWKSKQVSPCCILVTLITHFHFLWAMFWQNHWLRSTARAKQTSTFFTSMLKMQKSRLYYKWLINASEQYHSKVSHSITSLLTRHGKHVITCWYGNFSKWFFHLEIGRQQCIQNLAKLVRWIDPFWLNRHAEWRLKHSLKVT